MKQGMIQLDWKTWQELGQPDWREVGRKLLLPDAYRVTRVREAKINATDILVTVFVISDLIPDGHLCAQLKPIYHINCEPAGECSLLDQKAVFDHMELHGDQGWERLPKA
jgi:hypothetical protein